MPVAAKTRKPSYRPHIQKVAPAQYTCQSERWGGHILYLVTVHADGRTSCECEAGAHGKMCKHQIAITGYLAYCAHPTHIRPLVGQSSNGAAALMELFA